MPKGSPELTTARKEEIISACKKLYETMSFKEINLKEIGKVTSFTRTSIYNYFQTKEEIFLAILQQEYETWAQELIMLKGVSQPTAEKLADGIATSLEHRELMLKILSMNHFDMEENSRQENLNDFKVSYRNTVDAVNELLMHYCPEMSESKRNAFLYAFFPFLYGIYPYVHVTDRQREAMDAAGMDFTYHGIYDLTYPFIRQLLEVCN